MRIVIVACLFLHYAAAMTLFGAVAFRLLTPSAAAIDGRLTRSLRLLFIVFAVSAVLMLMAVASTMGGAWIDAADPGLLRDVLLGTAFGKAWQWHLGLIVLLGLAAWTTPPRRPWIALSAALALGSLAFVGHAAMVEGVPGDLRRLNQVVHLLSAGAWMGGLLPLLQVVIATRATPAASVPVLLRFSAYGTAAVALVLITGVINSVALVGSIDGLTQSTYGQVLLIKIALVIAMIGFAVHNRFQLTPRMSTEAASTAHRLRRSVGLEIALALGIVLLAGVLGTQQPPIG